MRTLQKGRQGWVRLALLGLCAYMEKERLKTFSGNITNIIRTCDSVALVLAVSLVSSTAFTPSRLAAAMRSTWERTLHAG